MVKTGGCQPLLGDGHSLENRDGMTIPTILTIAQKNGRCAWAKKGCCLARFATSELIRLAFATASLSMGPSPPSLNSSPGDVCCSFSEDRTLFQETWPAVCLCSFWYFKGHKALVEMVWRANRQTEGENRGRNVLPYVPRI